MSNKSESLSFFTNNKQKTPFFPSSIIQVALQDKESSFQVKIPEKETFRAKEIFQDEEYLILSKRSHTGPRIVVDIGANIGLYALYVKFVDPNSVIHCFEPSPSSLLLLHENVEHIPGIHIHPIGLSNRDGKAFINIHRLNTGQNSIKFQNQNYSHTDIIQLRDTGKQVDELNLNHIDILKIDTEGCEVEILESLGHRLCWIDYVLVEYHSEGDRRQIDKILKSFFVFGSKAVFPNAGVIKYVNSNLIENG